MSSQRDLLNYTPTVCLAILFTSAVSLQVYATVSSSLERKLNRLLAPVVLLATPLTFATCIVIAVWFGIAKGHVNRKLSWYNISHRAICTANLFLQLLWISCPLWGGVKALLSKDVSFGIIVLVVYAALMLWWVRVWVLYYSNNRCRKQLNQMANDRRGSSVYVSVPLFKTCGHFSVVVDNHKYELRLAGSGDPVPIYHSRVLQEEERSHFEDATFTFQWMHVGWTHFTHEERETRLRAVMDGFGPYNLFRNNCRHFVQAACQSVLHIVARTDAMFEVEVMTQTALALAFYYLVRPMLVQRDEFMHFIFICVLGPDWDDQTPQEKDIILRFGNDALDVGGMTGVKEWLVSSPGRINLFGDYLGAHGITTISASTDLRWYGLTTVRHDGKISICFPDFGNFFKEWLIDSLPWGAITWDNENPVHEILLDAIIQGPLRGFEDDETCPDEILAMIRVFLYMYLVTNRVAVKSSSFAFTARSTLPATIGLGSSVAFSTCITTCLLLVTRRISIPSVLRRNSSHSISLPVAQEINRWTSIAIKVMHNNPKKADVKLAIFGGIWERTRFYRSGTAAHAIKSLGTKPLRFLVTQPQMPISNRSISDELKQRSSEDPELVDGLLKHIQIISDNTKAALADDALSRSSLVSKLSTLIDSSYTLFMSLGLSCPRVEDTQAKAVADLYGLCSKLTAGDYNCCISTLIPDGFREENLLALVQELREVNFETHLLHVGGVGVGVLSTQNDHQFTTAEDVEANPTNSLLSGEHIALGRLRASFKGTPLARLGKYLIGLEGWQYI